MSIVSQNQQEEELFNTISSFFKAFKIGDLLRKCNAYKQKGVPVLDIFKYKLCNIFSDRSMYMQMKTKSFKESFSKNTFYRFLDSAKTNWLRFTTLLSKKVIDSLEPLTSDDRINAFIVDDSLFERTSCKKTELGAKVFDHCDRRYKKGFRLLSLLWTDGNTAEKAFQDERNKSHDRTDKQSIIGGDQGRIRSLRHMVFFTCPAYRHQAVRSLCHCYDT